MRECRKSGKALDERYPSMVFGDDTSDTTLRFHADLCGSRFEDQIRAGGSRSQKVKQHVRAAPMRTEPAAAAFAPCLPPLRKTPEHHKNCERNENGRRSRRLPATHVVGNCQQHDRCKPNGCTYAEP